MSTEKTTTQIEEATEVKENDAAKSIEKAKMVAELVNDLLEEHNCFMTAEMTIGERGVVPKVIILDRDAFKS